MPTKHSQITFSMYVVGDQRTQVISRWTSMRLQFVSVSPWRWFVSSCAWSWIVEDWEVSKHSLQQWGVTWNCCCYSQWHGCSSSCITFRFLEKARYSSIFNFFIINRSSYLNGNKCSVTIKSRNELPSMLGSQINTLIHQHKLLCLYQNFVDRVQQHLLSHIPRLQFIILSSTLLITLQYSMVILSMKIFYVIVVCLGARLLTLCIFSSLQFVIFRPLFGAEGFVIIKKLGRSLP
jgi:hypothetical protein